MKLTITIPVEVDVEAWGEAYGFETKGLAARQAIAEDVRSYALTQLQGAAASDENLWVVNPPRATRKAPKK